MYNIFATFKVYLRVIVSLSFIRKNENIWPSLQIIKSKLQLLKLWSCFAVEQTTKRKMGNIKKQIFGLKNGQWFITWCTLVIPIPIGLEIYNLPSLVRTARTPLIFPNSIWIYLSILFIGKSIWKNCHLFIKHMFQSWKCWLASQVCQWICQVRKQRQWGKQRNGGWQHQCGH